MNFLPLLLVVGCLSLVKVSYAVCPVCVIVVGAGIGIAEEFGVSDTIIGLWVGAFIIAMAWWTVNWLIKKNWCFKGCGSITFLAYYLLTLVPLYYSGFIGKELNKLWGVDKLLLGVLVGSVLFFLGERYHFYLKEKNGNKVYFPFQRVVVPVVALIIATIAFYFLSK